MALRFLSNEWVDEARRLVSSAPDFKRTATGIQADILTTVTEAPGGVTCRLFLAFNDGDLERLELLSDGVERSARFQIRGSYTTFARLHQGALSLQAAYFNRLVRIEGDLQQALRFAPAFLKYSEIVRQIPTEY